ncbi:MAG: M23 family metallopeptidase [Cyanobacteria bacterium J083]|nr:MAG: M23 family metallopeptidase [Cyanobacteria bacterium J083]
MHLSPGLFYCCLVFPSQAQNIPLSNQPSCPPPILSRLIIHKVKPGETVASIASQYNLFPETIIWLNPLLAAGNTPSPGREILIPPFNGIKLEVPAGITWQDLEKTYGVRADVLFELNGCSEEPSVIFLPGINWELAQNKQKKQNYNGLNHYPLLDISKIGLNYGWQDNSLFHSGIDFLADIGSEVFAAANGTVVFAGQAENYGNLIVIDHPNGTQTRYAHLDNDMNVWVGKQIQAGEIIGQVGTTGIPDIPQPHLHFEVRSNSPLGWLAQDPLIHLPK